MTNGILEYFSTDWAAMTLHDWIGTIITVAVFVGMIYMFVKVLHPKNKAEFESRRHLIDVDTEERHE